IGAHCTEYEQGDRIFSSIKETLDAGAFVDVDMQGVQLATSSFFNAALGPLYGAYPVDVLRDRVKFSHLTKEMRHVVSRSLEATKKFYQEQKSA
ncbi:MAG TPA: STAS-like domain-containing protein, partial [Nitrospiria bacterium]